ncbi:MAG: hypothetical protein HY962_12790 [Ignavibacteriae bacterium]|nr:hypothetical protein [Ignavibacteriota bacterium]
MSADVHTHGSSSADGHHLTLDAGPACTLLLHLDASVYPVERHCRYARPADGPLRLFSALTWHEEEPGLRVGPWPGWRGIPDMPDIHVLCEDREIHGRWVFFGDEIHMRRLHVAFELPAHSGITVALRCTDARLQYISHEFLAGARPAARPVPLVHPAHGRHPRLLTGERDLEEMRVRARGGHPSWTRLCAVAAAPGGFRETAQAKIPAGSESASLEDQALIAACIAAVQPGDEEIRRAHESFRACLEQSADPGFGPLGIDTQLGEYLAVLCTAFDLLHGTYTETERTAIHASLARLAEACAAFLTPGRRDYAQAHYLGCGLGLLAYCALDDGADPRVERWGAEVHGAFREVLSMLPDDGSHPHGINLWIYEYGFLFRWLEMLRHTFGLDYWEMSGHWERASRFRGDCTSSAARRGITFGDTQFRTGGDAWMHYLVARRTGSADAAALADRLEPLPVEGVDFRCAPLRRRVYEFLYAADVGPDTAHGKISDDAVLYSDLGQAVLRSADVTLVARCGAPLGRSRRAAGEAGGYGHSDPCNGSILLERAGVLVLAGPGPVYRRDTALQNLYTVDGRGQLGDGMVWAPDCTPDRHIPDNPVLYSRGDVSCLAMQFGCAYLDDLGVTSCTRALALFPDGALLVVDRISLAETRSVQWNLHTQALLESRGFAPCLTFAVKAGGADGRLQILPGAPFSWTQSDCEFVPAYPHDGTRDTHLRLSFDGAKGTVVWTLAFGRDDELRAAQHGPRVARLSLGPASLLFDFSTNLFEPAP